MLEFLRTTRVGCVGVGRVPPEDRGEEADGEEGGPGPPQKVIPLCSFSLVRLHTLSGDERGGFSFVFLLSFILVVGGPTMTG